MASPKWYPPKDQQGSLAFPSVSQQIRQALRKAPATCADLEDLLGYSVSPIVYRLRQRGEIASYGDMREKIYRLTPRGRRRTFQE